MSQFDKELKASRSRQILFVQKYSLAAKLHPIFERLSVPYYITGGVAAIA